MIKNINTTYLRKSYLIYFLYHLSYRVVIVWTFDSKNFLSRVFSVIFLQSIVYMHMVTLVIYDKFLSHLQGFANVWYCRLLIHFANSQADRVHYGHSFGLLPAIRRKKLPVEKRKSVYHFLCSYFISNNIYNHNIHVNRIVTIFTTIL